MGPPRPDALGAKGRRPGTLQPMMSAMGCTECQPPSQPSGGGGPLGLPAAWRPLAEHPDLRPWQRDGLFFCKACGAIWRAERDREGWWSFAPLPPRLEALKEDGRLEEVLREPFAHPREVHGYLAHARYDPDGAAQALVDRLAAPDLQLADALTALGWLLSMPRNPHHQPRRGVVVRLQDASPLLELLARDDLHPPHGWAESRQRVRAAVASVVRELDQGRIGADPQVVARLREEVSPARREQRALRTLRSVARGRTEPDDDELDRLEDALVAVERGHEAERLAPERAAQRLGPVLAAYRRLVAAAAAENPPGRATAVMAAYRLTLWRLYIFELFPLQLLPEALELLDPAARVVLAPPSALCGSPASRRGDANPLPACDRCRPDRGARRRVPERCEPMRGVGPFFDGQLVAGAWVASGEAHHLARCQTCGLLWWRHLDLAALAPAVAPLPPSAMRILHHFTRPSAVVEYLDGDDYHACRPGGLRLLAWRSFHGAYRTYDEADALAALAGALARDGRCADVTSDLLELVLRVVSLWRLDLERRGPSPFDAPLEGGALGTALVAVLRGTPGHVAGREAVRAARARHAMLVDAILDEGVRLGPRVLAVDPPVKAELEAQLAHARR